MRFFCFHKSSICLLTLGIFLNLLSVSAQKNIQTLQLELKKASQNPNYLSDSNSIKLLNQLGEKYIFDKPDSAIYFAKKSLEASKKIQHADLALINATIIIAKANYVIGNNFASLEASDNALELSQKINYQKGIAYALKNKGLIYLSQDRHEEAIDKFNKSLQLSEKIGDSANMASIYYDLVLCYEDLKDFNKASAYLDKTIEFSRRIQDWHIHLMAINRLAETYYNQKNYDKSIRYYELALNFKLYHDNWESSFAYSGLGQVYLALSEYDKAIANAQSSLNFSTIMKASWDEYRAVSILSKAYAGKADYKNAYQYETRLRLLSDTLYNEANEKESNYLHLQEKEVENLKLLKENQISRNAIKLNHLIIFFTGLGLLLLVIIILTSRKNSSKINHLNKELQKKNKDIAIQKDEILQQKEALSSLNQTKDMLFSVISHDLRSPFASIQASLDLLRRGQLSQEDFDKLLNNFQQEINMVSGLVNNLLAWANSQQKGIHVLPEKIDLTAIAEEVISISQLLASDKHQSLIHTKNTSPLWIMADPNHVKIILQNLLGNAIKFSHSGRKIAIFYSDHDAYTAIHIKDDGIGMAPEKLEKLFKVIGKKISASGTNKEKGSGIGLMLIKQFIEDNGGYLDIKSELGKGSEFIVYFKKETLNI